MSEQRDANHEEAPTFMIPDDQGNEHEMMLVHTFASEEQLYAVLLEKDNLEADGVIFRVEEEDDEAYLVSIEDDEEWERIVTIYNAEVASQADE